MPPLTVPRLQLLLRDFVRQTGNPVDLILIGALATEAYGVPGRPTVDVDAEVHGPLEALPDFFDKADIPSDLATFPPPALTCSAVSPKYPPNIPLCQAD